ncbi:MAG: hypothetical protein HC876_05935 [Chloroflexaceae bacterium]|nr:hypothetical protein [Chloroflexaceae bacterium]
MPASAGAQEQPAAAQQLSLSPESGTLSSNPHDFVQVGDMVYFIATATETGSELWKTDGTAEGTVLVRDILPGPQSSGVWYLTAVADTLYFVADDGRRGRELWRSDGTETGTVLVADIEPRQRRFQSGRVDSIGRGAVL